MRQSRNLMDAVRKVQNHNSDSQDASMKGHRRMTSDGRVVLNLQHTCGSSRVCRNGAVLHLLRLFQGEQADGWSQECEASVRSAEHMVSWFGSHPHRNKKQYYLDDTVILPLPTRSHIWNMDEKRDTSGRYTHHLCKRDSEDILHRMASQRATNQR